MVAETKPPSHSELPGLPGYHPYNLQPWIVMVSSTATALGVVSVILRFSSRWSKRQPLWWDDWMIVWSGAWSLAALGLLFRMHSLGLGLHADVLEPKNVVRILQLLVPAETLYGWSLGWTKLSVVLMYYRIFRIERFKIWAFGVGGLVMAWCVCVTFLFVFTCTPVEKLWYPHLEGRCISQKGVYVANGISTIVTDLMILIMPAPCIWSLQLRTMAKIGLVMSFATGGFVVFVSSYRVKVLLTYSNSDPSYTLAPTVGWTAIELSAGFVSANLPTMLPVLILFGRWLRSANIFRSFRTTNNTSGKTRSRSSIYEITNQMHSFHRIKESDETGGGLIQCASQNSTTPLDGGSTSKHKRNTSSMNFSRKFHRREGSKGGDTISLQEIRPPNEVVHPTARSPDIIDTPK